MRKLSTFTLLFCSVNWAQETRPVKHPQVVSAGYMSQMRAPAKFSSVNKMTVEANTATKQQRVNSVPTFARSFTYGGVTFPYTMVGRDPQKGDTTRVDSALVTIQFVFDEYTDQTGNRVVIDAATVAPLVLKGPDFEKTSYGTGNNVQYADAVQRAEFFQVMKPDWHTVLTKPRILQPVQVEVPFGMAFVFQAGAGGPMFALIDDGFFVSQLNTILQFEPFRVGDLAIVLTKNALFYQGGDPGNCCVLGYHTSFDMGAHGNRHDVQTFVTASWMDTGIYGDPGRADINFLSHEIAEWMNDPFVNNIVPPWQIPFEAACQSILEPSDPFESFPTNAFPVTLDGFTYHPQVQAMLQWFERQVPSSAFQGAYSYPDTTMLTAPSPCPGT